MKTANVFRNTVLSCTAAVLLFVPQLASSAVPQSGQITNVVMHQGGVMVGRLLDSQAQPVAGRQVALRQAKKVVATVETDKNGQFAVRGLRSGIYTLESGNSRSLVAAWNESAAPPTARPSVTIVVGDRQVVRGQDDNGRTPLVIGATGAIIAGAVTAIVIDDDAS